MAPEVRLCQTLPMAPHDPDSPDPELEPVRIPIDGVLDLHPFAPRDVKSVVVEYVAECVAAGLTDLRIIHGKGRGNLRRTVHATLGRIPEVESYALAGTEAGGWGATLVKLAPPDGGRANSEVPARPRSL